MTWLTGTVGPPTYSGHMSPKQRRSKTADMGIYPDAETYTPPADCVTREWTTDLADGVAFAHAIHVHKGKIAHFSIQQIHIDADGVRHDVARIDTSHGTIHRHQQFASGAPEDRHEFVAIPATGGVTFVHDAYARYADVLTNAWSENLRRWTNG